MMNLHTLRTRIMLIIKNTPYKPTCNGNWSSITRRHVALYPCLHKRIPDNLKGKSVSSQHWLTRQINDPYVEAAKMKNYRCRSVFKLIEIDDRIKILSPGQVVVDCGAAPGSWSQIAAERTNADGNSDSKPIGAVIAVDLLHIFPLPGVTCISRSDFTSEKTHKKIQQILGERKVDVVLSDMAPRCSGLKEIDHDQIISLAYSVLQFAAMHSKLGASVLIKIWEGRSKNTLVEDLGKFYDTVKYVKPPASRDDSSEIYILARGFKGYTAEKVK